MNSTNSSLGQEPTLPSIESPLLGLHWGGTEPYGMLDRASAQNVVPPDLEMCSYQMTTRVSVVMSWLFPTLLDVRGILWRLLNDDTVDWMCRVTACAAFSLLCFLRLGSVLIDCILDWKTADNSAEWSGRGGSQSTVFEDAAVQGHLPLSKIDSENGFSP